MIVKKVIKRCPTFGLKLYAYLRFLILPIRRIDETLPKIGTITDYGCGFGVVSCYLALSSKRRKIAGIEYDAGRIKKARIIGKGIKNVKFIVGDASKKRITKSNANLLIDVIHHIPYDGQIKLLNNIIKSARKNDLIIIKDIGKKPLLKYFLTNQEAERSSLGIQNLLDGKVCHLNLQKHRIFSFYCLINIHYSS